MRQQPRCVELLDGDAAAAIGNQIHDDAPALNAAIPSFPRERAPGDWISRGAPQR
jgi:hypothetical protein